MAYSIVKKLTILKDRTEKEVKPLAKSDYDRGFLDGYARAVDIALKLALEAEVKE
jgi:hypothetical protein